MDIINVLDGISDSISFFHIQRMLEKWNGEEAVSNSKVYKILSLI